MSQVILITLLIVGLSVLLMGVRVFFTKRWGFPSSHVDAQPRLRQMGLSCHRQQHREAQQHRNLFERLADQQD